MSRFTRLLLITFAGLSIVPSAKAWGCAGHQIVALIAEAHLNPRAHAAALQILAASPISSTLPRYCKPASPDPFADSSTWADDERGVRPDTAPWHFIDIPRGAPKSDMAKYCPPSIGCITSALMAQVRILRDDSASPQARAEALRFVIHFVGDIHQPLHAATNNDRGGNCIPVAFFRRNPRETNPQQEDYSPNLHSIWDVDIIEQFSGTETPEQLASELNSKFGASVPVSSAAASNFAAWAWETHQLAETTAYGRLPVKIAIEVPHPITGCADDNHVSTRMLQLNEHLTGNYQNDAAPVVQQQLARAGVRLASLLNLIWP